MSHKIYLVKYLLEDGIPIDDTSKKLRSTYIPDELLDWLNTNGLAIEVEMKEAAGEEPDVPVMIIDDGEQNLEREVIAHVEGKIIDYVQETNKHIVNDLHVAKELDSDFKSLLVWLKVREILKEKAEKYTENPNIKIIVG